MWVEFISKNDLVKQQYKNILLEKGLDEQEIKEYFEDLDRTCYIKK